MNDMGTQRAQRLEQLLQRSIPFLFWAAELTSDKVLRDRCHELMTDIITDVPRLGGVKVDGKID
jgi:serine kinase of HPr protein (carbohydrate metabolism regulator)